MKVVIDLSQVKKLQKKGTEIFLKPEAEKALVQLLKTQEKVAEAIDKTREILEQKALKYNPNFSSIRSDKIRVYYREFGAKFRVDDSHLKELPKELYKVRKSYSVNNKELESFVNEKGSLPLGIIENERKKRITISLNK